MIFYFTLALASNYDKNLLTGLEHLYYYYSVIASKAKQSVTLSLSLSRLSLYKGR
jgi:hypothetical protein